MKTFYIVLRPTRSGKWRVWGTASLLVGDSADFPLNPPGRGAKTFASYDGAMVHAEYVERVHPHWTLVR